MYNNMPLGRLGSNRAEDTSFDSRNTDGFYRGTAEDCIPRPLAVGVSKLLIRKFHYASLT